MTLEEAIKEIQKVVDKCPWPGTVEEHKCLLAWLKDYQTMLQKPERTAKVIDYWGKWGHCGECGSDVFHPSEHEWMYCPHCGARLEWE